VGRGCLCGHCFEPGDRSAPDTGGTPGVLCDICSADYDCDPELDPGYRFALVSVTPHKGVCRWVEEPPYVHCNAATPQCKVTFEFAIIDLNGGPGEGFRQTLQTSCGGSTSSELTGAWGTVTCSLQCSTCKTPVIPPL
jgi:hypothetical protein